MQKNLNTKLKTITNLFTNQKAVEQLKKAVEQKFSMERKAGLAFIAGVSLTGVFGSENPSSSSMVIGLSIDPSSHLTRERGNRRMVEPHV